MISKSTGPWIALALLLASLAFAKGPQIWNAMAGKKGPTTAPAVISTEEKLTNVEKKLSEFEGTIADQKIQLASQSNQIIDLKTQLAEAKAGPTTAATTGSPAAVSKEARAEAPLDGSWGNETKWHRGKYQPFYFITGKLDVKYETATGEEGMVLMDPVKDPKDLKYLPSDTSRFWIRNRDGVARTDTTIPLELVVQFDPY